MQRFSIRAVLIIKINLQGECQWLAFIEIGNFKSIYWAVWHQFLNSVMNLLGWFSIMTSLFSQLWFWLRWMWKIRTFHMSSFHHNITLWNTKHSWAELELELVPLSPPNAPCKAHKPLHAPWPPQEFQGATLGVPWSLFEGIIVSHRRLIGGHLGGTLGVGWGSLWGYPEVTLKLPWGHCEGILRVTFWILGDHFVGTLRSLRVLWAHL